MGCVFQVEGLKLEQRDMSTGWENAKVLRGKQVVGHLFELPL